MAGMLPGVECARRRRFHQSGSESQSAPSHGWTRKPSFCLYTSNHEKSHHLTTSTSLMQRSLLSQAYQDDDKLGVEAREAKERLDERLRIAQRKSIPKRHNGKSNNGSLKGEKVVIEVQNSNEPNKKSGNNIGGGTKRFMKWAKLSWKSSEQEECTICLERFKESQSIVHLPCAHKFHNRCLLPWLEANPYCPCCRMGIVSS